MFQCIACSKQQREEDEEGHESGTPKRKEAVKSLTGQIKDMVLKVSGACKQSKPSTGSSSGNRGKKPYPDYETISEGVQYPYMGGVGSGSTPSWDLRSSLPGGSRSVPRYIGGIGGDQTPRRLEPAAAQGVGLEAEEEAREWVAQVEPGVHITFESLPTGGNGLKRIRFNREMFDKWQAQRWWGENYDRIMELYNVQSFNRYALNTSDRFEDEQREPSPRDSPVASWLNSTAMTHYYQTSASGIILDQSGGENLNEGEPSMEAPRTTNSSIEEPAFNNGIDMDSEWIEQDQPGVLITVRVLPDGAKELRRVRFSRQRFDEEGAKKWWEENRERVEADYL